MFPSGALVINLDQRMDRWERFQKEESIRLRGINIERVSAVQGTDLPGYGQPPFFHGRKKDRRWAARGGCLLSHRKALEIAKAKDWEQVLILEDDVVLPDNLQDLLARVAELFHGEEPTVFYPGYTDPVKPYRKIKKLLNQISLYRVYGCNTAHAYIVNRPMYDKILDQLPTAEDLWHWLTVHRAIDRWYYRNLASFSRVYALSHAKIVQKEGYSDIVGGDVKKITDLHKVEILEEEGTHKFGFRCGKLFQRLKFWFSHHYDRMRGLYKRRRGF